MRYIIALLAFLAVPASAQTIEEAMWEDMRWIAQNSDYELPETLPAIEYVSHQEMQLLYYGAQKIADAEEHGYELGDIVGAYDPLTRTMYLKEGYDLANNRSTLVHELVHHMQEMGGHFEDEECMAAREPDAYKLHNKWIDETGAPDEHTDPMFMIMLANVCGSHY